MNERILLVQKSGPVASTLFRSLVPAAQQLIPGVWFSLSGVRLRMVANLSEAGGLNMHVL